MMAGSRAEAVDRETARLRGFQRQADAVSSLILNTDLPWVDIAIRIEQLRHTAKRLFPGTARLFDMVYISRYKRLWEQWRGGAEGRGSG